MSDDAPGDLALETKGGLCIRKISLVMPVAGEGQREFAALLQGLLTSHPPGDPRAMPELDLRMMEDTGAPQLEFDDGCPLRVAIGTTSGNGAGSDSGTHALIAPGTMAPCLPLMQILSALQGRIRRLNHAGVGFSASLAEHSGWREALTRIRASGFLHRLETGTDDKIWFLLPATPEEYAAGRLRRDLPTPGPMFELSHSLAAPGHTLHFNLETDLPRRELLARFSGRGVFKPGDNAYFLSVCAASPWRGLTVYLDLSPGDEDTVVTSRSLLIDIGRREV
jgi:hypothetical protein